MPQNAQRRRMMIQNESVAFRSDLLFVNIKPYKSHISFKTLPHIHMIGASLRLRVYENL